MLRNNKMNCLGLKLDKTELKYRYKMCFTSDTKRSQQTAFKQNDRKWTILIHEGKFSVGRINVAVQDVKVLYIAAATDVFTKSNRGETTATANNGPFYSKGLWYWQPIRAYTPDSGRKVNILGRDSTGHCEKQNVTWTSVSEWLPK